MTPDNCYKGFQWRSHSTLCKCEFGKGHGRRLWDSDFRLHVYDFCFLALIYSCSDNGAFVRQEICENGTKKKYSCVKLDNLPPLSIVTLISCTNRCKSEQILKYTFLEPGAFAHVLCSAEHKNYNAWGEILRGLHLANGTLLSLHWKELFDSCAKCKMNPDIVIYLIFNAFVGKNWRTLQPLKGTISLSEGVCAFGFANYKTVFGNQIYILIRKDASLK